MEEFRRLTEPFDIIDALCGVLSGSYSYDLDIAQAKGITFSVEDYESAFQMDEQQ